MSEATNLLELQSVDLEIIRATKRLDELPEKSVILEARAKQREANALHTKAEVLVRKLESEVKARQDELALLKDKIDSEQRKVMETTDHRAVQSITREMDGLRRRCDKLEMESLQYMERVEKAQAQVAAIAEHVGKLQEREAAYVARYQQVGGGIQKEIATLERKRKKLAAGVDPTLLARYESVRDSRGGIGVGELDGVMCTACRMELPAERIKELLEGDQVGTCPHCRRIIVVHKDAE